MGMNRATLARRYGPLVAVIAIQLLIIAAVPSKGPETQAVTAGAAGDSPGGFIPGPEEGTFIDPTTGQIITADGTVVGTTGTGGAAPGAAGGAGAGAGGAAGGPAVAAGSTAHCVDGRQFDPAFYYYAPICVPKFTGDNGGATYQGVTKDTIKIVVYIGNLGPAVDALLDAQGSNPAPADRQRLNAAAAKVISEKYELYGRKLEIKEWEGQCAAVPPDYPCLRNEMRQVVSTEKPFAVLWRTSLASPAFDELSALKVLNLGGWHFREVFSQQRRPYHWDITMSGDDIMQMSAEWWCKRMHGGKARYAGETGDGAGQNPSTNDIRSRTRVLGVISTDDPENKLAVNILKAELAKCGAKVEHEFYYSQDITRAEEQRRLAVAKMREAPESTSIMCFCDLVAPIFLYQTCEEQGYYPEHIMIGSGFMDSDAAAQAYDHTLPPEGHQFENAFGLSSITAQPDRRNNAATRVWKAGGQSGEIPDSYASSVLDWEYFGMLASLIQGAGPNLTPANVEAGAFRQPPRGGATQTTDIFLNRRSFSRGDYAWNDDMREVYWSTTKPSTYNQEPGHYVTLNNGVRFMQGQFPSGPFTIPEKPR
jgi:hypothetical protein